MASYLQVVDYVLIVISLTISSGAGFYYGIIRKKDNSVEEYFFASRDLNLFQLTCSIFATVLASGTIVGLVAEVYYYGTQSLLSNVVSIFNRAIVMHIFFPVFYNIGSFDVNMYYEMKFNRLVRCLISTIAIFKLTLYSSIVLYGTSTALSTSSGINPWFIIVFLSALASSYSALGGVRGVSLADMIQGLVIFGSTILILIIGIISVGGIDIVWQRNWDGERIEFFNFDINPKVRHTFWTATVSSFIYGIAWTSIDPLSIMKFMASSSVVQSKRAAYLSSAMLSIANILCGFTGLVIYSNYYQCDPKANDEIKSANQIISTFINHLSNYQGLAGVFYSSLLCAAISTLSSQLNTLSALTMETYFKSFKILSKPQNYTRVAKVVTFAMALLSLLGTIIVGRIPTIFQAIRTIGALTTAPHFALLLTGTLFPAASLKSYVACLFFGIAITLWIVIGSVFVEEMNVTKPISTIGCFPNSTNANNTIMGIINSTLNVTNQSNVSHNHSSINQWEKYFPLSTVSFTWYSTVSILITLASFPIFAFIFGAEKTRKIDVNLVSKPIQRLHKKLNKRWRKILLCDIYPDEINEDVIQTQKKLLENPKDDKENTQRNESTVI